MTVRVGPECSYFFTQPRVVFSLGIGRAFVEDLEYDPIADKKISWQCQHSERRLSLKNLGHYSELSFIPNQMLQWFGRFGSMSCFQDVR